MKHRLDAGNLTLEIELTIYENDIQFPENTVMDIYVNSDNFSARTYMDIDIEQFSVFSGKLFDIYRFLKGTAVIEEPYGKNYIKFEALKRGHIQIEGVLDNKFKNGFTQKLFFENEFDQTFLGNFSKELFDKYGNNMNCLER